MKTAATVPALPSVTVTSSIARSGSASTVVCSDSELLSAFGSNDVVVTVAVFSSVPAAAGTTTIVTTALAPALIEPSWHVTTPSTCAQAPVLVVVFTKATAAGSGP